MTLLTVLYALEIAAMIEIVIMIYCILTKSFHRKSRAILRIGIFIVTLASYILLGISWNLYTLPLLLFLLTFAVNGAITLVRENRGEQEGGKREDKRTYKSSKCIRSAIGTFLLILLALFPSILAPKYIMIPPTGELPVNQVLYTYTDENRIETYSENGENRWLNVEFWYPEEAREQCPLIIFSHGGYGIRSSNESLYNELASHGYVVCSIDHTYQCFSTTDPDGNTVTMDSGYSKELARENAKVDKKNSFDCYRKWMAIRTADISFVLDTILENADQTDTEEVYQLIDTEKIGTMGHSLGGAAALGIGRSRSEVDAVIALESPYLCDIIGIEEDQFVYIDEAFPKPVLNVYSDASWDKLTSLPQYAENYRILSDSDPDTRNVYLSGIGHLALTDFALSSPVLTRILDGNLFEKDARSSLKQINEMTLAFFDYYLKGVGEFTY